MFSGKTISYFFLFLLSPSCLFTQSNKIDSLKKVLFACKEDSNKVNVIRELNRQLIKSGDYIVSMQYAKDGLKLAEKINYKIGIGDAYSTIGKIYFFSGNYPTALDNHSHALKIRIEIKDSIGIAASYNNIGIIYAMQGNNDAALKNYFLSLGIKERNGDKEGAANGYHNIGIIYDEQGNYPEALKNHFKSLKISESIDDQQGIATSYMNIGIIYSEQNNQQEALEYNFKAAKINEEINDMRSLADTYNNIGTFYMNQNNYTDATKYHELALKIRNEIGDKSGIATSYSNLGALKYFQHDYPQSLKFHLQSLKIREEIGDKEGTASSNTSSGQVYTSLGKFSSSSKINLFNKADEYLNKGLKIAKELNNKDDIREAYFGLCELDSVMGNFKKEFEDYKLQIIYKDSLINEENTKKSVRTSMQYEFDKKETQSKAEQDKKDAVAQAEKNKQQVILYSVIVGLGVVLLFALFIFRSLLQIRKKNIEITLQKKIIEEKQKEILDSIHYAARIQRCILPTEKYISQNLARLKMKRKKD